MAGPVKSPTNASHGRTYTVAVSKVGGQGSVGALLRLAYELNDQLAVITALVSAVVPPQAADEAAAASSAPKTRFFIRIS
jgi:hypothetical protein